MQVAVLCLRMPASLQTQLSSNVHLPNTQSLQVQCSLFGREGWPQTPQLHLR